MNFSIDNQPDRFIIAPVTTVTKAEISRVMSAIGKRTSEKKAASSRRNGLRGGRPKKQKTQ